MIGEEIAHRKFVFNDQINFAKFTGDFNPIHIDPIEARKTLFGKVIVHGINAVFWALDEIAISKGLVFKKINVRYVNPIYLNEEINCYWIANDNLILLKIHDIVVVSMAVTIGKISNNSNSVKIFHKNYDEPIFRSFHDCLQLGIQKFILRGDIDIGYSLYPNFFKNYGPLVGAELAGISQVVGMECPGLNSLFASLVVDIGKRSNVRSRMKYAVKGDDRFKLLKISFNGSVINANANVFYRPTPVEDISLCKIQHYVDKDEFSDVSALIIGGSRGLGKQVAKIIAAGGGKSVITYNLGKDDAERVAVKIKDFGGACEAIHFNIENITELPNDFNQLYYFATPKIFPDAKNLIDHSSFLVYQQYYVNAFYRICTNLRNRNLMPSIFYPSTIYADDNKHNFQTYASAKLQGEKLIHKLIKDFGMKIIHKRLPRFKTDQNLKIVEEEFEDEFLYLIPIIRNMNNKILFDGK